MIALKNIFLFSILIHFSCANSNKSIVYNPNTISKTTAFQKLLKRQGFVEIPSYNLAGLAEDKNLQPLISDESDSMFFKKDYMPMGKIYGVYKDTSQFFLFITFYAAENYIPAIETFDKNGNRISSEQLLVNGCGAGCGYYCTMTAEISKDLSFIAKDSVLFYECDSLAKETPGTREHYVEYFTGKIDNTGRINREKTKKINLDP